MKLIVITNITQTQANMKTNKEIKNTKDVAYGLVFKVG